MFVDTGGWAKLLIRDEPFHELSTSLIERVVREGDAVVSSNYVLAELSALMMSPLRVPRAMRLELINRIRTASWVRVEHVDESLDAASWDYLGRRPDKDYSLVDCSSFVIMERLGLTEALTNDRHFEQAGFVRLLKTH